MAAQASVSVPPNEPASIDEQKQQIDRTQNATSNGFVPDSQDPTVQAAMRIQERYEQEKNKRLRDEPLSQFIDLSTSDKFQHFRSDPWLNERSELQTLQDGDRVKFLVLGAGFGGVLFGTKLVTVAGQDPKDVYIVDSAGGFGGTWYFNRYPGLMCDVESYCYLPLLEEMGYVPEHKYSYGPEIRQYINDVASKHGLDKNAMFRTTVTNATWDDASKEWLVSLTKRRSDEPAINLTIRSQFLMTMPGLLLHVQLPNVPGLGDFKGHSFHTSRWDYDYTGGSENKPDLVNIKDKRVGIVGTGATAVQCVPHLARWAKKLYVFQRTASQVDARGQRQTDPVEWSQDMSEKGWQEKRRRNMNDHYCDPARGLPERNLVNDGWSSCHAYRGLLGGRGIVKMEDIPAYVAKLHAEDIPRSESIRARVSEAVKDEKTAESLKSWYPSWCKRPCFHDEYLQTFNLPNVHLVDTDGKGVEHFTEKGAVVDGREYEFDCLIFSTGFRSPAMGGPAAKANMKIVGRDGKDLEEKYAGPAATLHGVVTHDFPNLFIAGPFQCGATPNNVHLLDTLSSHSAHIIKEAAKVAEKKKAGARWSVEPSEAAEEAWTHEILKRVANLAGMSGCTPGYLNLEGMLDKIPMEQRMIHARKSQWAEGMSSYTDEIERWRSEGRLADLEVQT